MTEMHIDRLTLKLQGRHGREARRLAEKMVERLRHSDWGDDWAQPEEDISVKISAAPGTTQRMAERAATEVMRKLRRI